MKTKTPWSIIVSSWYGFVLYYESLYLEGRYLCRNLALFIAALATPTDNEDDKDTGKSGWLYKQILPKIMTLMRNYIFRGM